MRDYRQENMANSFNAQSLLQIVRVAGSVVGVVTIIIGLTFATRTFASVYAALRAPEDFKEHIGKWIATVGGDQLNLVISGKSFPCANIFAIVVLGAGATILAWISMGLIVAGAKAISWTSSDREAIKRILEHALGPARGPERNKPAGVDSQ